MAIAGEIAVGIVVGLVSSVVSTHLALRRYRSERWWDKKYDAYTAILNSFHSLLQGVEASHKEILTDTEPTEEQQAESNRRYREAISEIERHITLGTFLLRHDAIESLEKLKNDLKAANNTHDFMVHLDASEWAYRDALTKIRELAREELSGARRNWAGWVCHR